LTVHHLGISQSERIVWLCEELEMPYVLKRYDRDPQIRMAPAEYKALHPLGAAPVITDGDLVLSESGAIIEYIIGKYGNGRLVVGPDASNYADYLFWYHFANGTMMPDQLAGLMVNFVGEDNPMAQFMQQRAERGWLLMEDRLGKMPYLAGADFTAADIINLFALTTMRAFVPRDLANYPNLRAYLKRIGERPAYRRAMEKAEPGWTPMLS
jgi:glutathione S-transferase